MQEEPIEALDAERAGQLAAIGIVNGQPFAPDDRMRGILDQAAQIGAGHRAHARLRPPRPGRACSTGRGRTRSSAAATSSCANGARLLDARTQFHYLATVITPAMAHAQVGAGSAYAYTVARHATATCSTARGPTGCTSTRTRRRRTSGRSTSTTPRPGRCCRCRRRIWPALASNSGTLQANDDGSYDLYFGPHRARGQGVELGRDDPRQVLVPDLPALRPARAVVRPDLETQRVRTHRLSPDRYTALEDLPSRRSPPSARPDPADGGTVSGWERRFRLAGHFAPLALANWVRA